MSSDEEQLTSSESEQELDDDEFSDEEAPEGDPDVSFGKKYEELLNEPIPEGKCPILALSKIPKRIEEERLKHLHEVKLTVSMKQTKRNLLNQYKASFNDFDMDQEKAMRKKATKGVIELFTAISKAQNKANPAEVKVPEKKDEDIPQTQDDFFEALAKAAKTNKEN